LEFGFPNERVACKVDDVASARLGTSRGAIWFLFVQTSKAGIDKTVQAEALVGIVQVGILLKVSTFVFGPLEAPINGLHSS
jgi:hypothetical protein